MSGPWWPVYAPVDRYARAALELEVQNLIGPLDGIERLTTADLYGIRDRARRPPRRSYPAKPRLNGEEIDL